MLNIYNLRGVSGRKEMCVVRKRKMYGMFLV